MKDRFDSFQDPRTVHFSVDDVGNSLSWACKNTPESIWEMHFFGKLRDFHIRFGTEVTLYCFFEICAEVHFVDIPKKYCSEFSEASNWLKFGFHSVNNKPFKKNNDWKNEFAGFCNFLKTNRMGTTDILRVHYWNATAEQELSLAEKGVCTLLISPENKTYFENGIWHRQTRTYFERISDEIKEAVLGIGHSPLIAFTHEQVFENQVSKIEAAFSIYTKNNYKFLS